MEAENQRLSKENKKLRETVEEIHEIMNKQWKGLFNEYVAYGLIVRLVNKNGLKAEIKH